MANMPYEARLIMLGMEILATRRLKLNMQFAYKVLFGIVDTFRREMGITYRTAILLYVSCGKLRTSFAYFCQPASL
jgi:hypothetical protein